MGSSWEGERKGKLQLGCKRKIFKCFYVYQFDLPITSNNKFILIMEKGREWAILFKCQEFQLLTAKGFI